jgi:hypothetical protein
MTERRKIDWRVVIIAICSAVIAALGGGVSTVAWQGCGRKPPDVPPREQEPDPLPPDPTPDPSEAIAKLALQGSFCSATIISPRRPDGKWWVVSAAHCYGRGPGVGVRGELVTRSGQVAEVVCVAIDRRADIALLVTDKPFERLPSIPVAENTPSPGVPIFHSGYGQHIPGNREDGQITRGPNQDGQVQYRLSVSPGDSGGGIVVNVGGQLLSPVCCTTCLGCPGDVWGGSPERIRRMMSAPTQFIDLPPAVMPAPPKEMPAGKGG